MENKVLSQEFCASCWFLYMFLGFTGTLRSFVIGSNAYQVHWKQPYHLLMLKNWWSAKVIAGSGRDLFWVSIPNVWWCYSENARKSRVWVPVPEFLRYTFSFLAKFSCAVVWPWNEILNVQVLTYVFLQFIVLLHVRMFGHCYVRHVEQRLWLII